MYGKKALPLGEVHIAKVCAFVEVGKLSSAEKQTKNNILKVFMIFSPLQKSNARSLTLRFVASEN